MVRYLPIGLLFMALTLSAQELHTFSNGEVADAEKINENFNVVSNQIEALSVVSTAPPLSAWQWVDADGRFVGYGLPDNSDVFTRFEVDDYVYRIYEISTGNIQYAFNSLYFASPDCSGEPFLYTSRSPSNFSSSPFGLDMGGYIWVAGEQASETVELRSKTVRRYQSDIPPTNPKCQEIPYSAGQVLRSTIPTGVRHVVTHTEPARLVWSSLKTSGQP